MTTAHSGSDTPAVRSVAWIDRTPSTNDALRERLAADDALPSGTLIAARQQTAGRGRQGRAWVSLPGRDLAFSLLLRVDRPATTIPTLAMASALAVRDSLVRFSLSAQVKWPNDVLAAQGKIAGILVETLGTDRAGRTRVIVGIGINVNMDAGTAATIACPASSIHIETGRTDCTIESVLDTLIPRLNARLSTWQHHGFAALKADWLAHMAYLHKPMTLQRSPLPPGDTIQGIVRGVNAAGALLLEDDTTTHTICTGELDATRLPAVE